MITFPQAENLVLQKCDFSLQRHLVFVSKAMEAMHGHLNPPETKEEWAITGLLHDIDWNETISNPKEHCGEKTKNFLLSQGLPQDWFLNIQSHCDFHQVPRENLIRKALVSIDELSGFTVAVALMRPEKLNGMQADSVMKKMKDKAFAKAVSREDMRAAENYFQIPLAKLLDEVLLPAFRTIKPPWGLMPL